MATGVALLSEAQKIIDHVSNVILTETPTLHLEYISKLSKLPLNTRFYNVDLNHTMHCA